jgi:hypothetical protein
MVVQDMVVTTRHLGAGLSVPACFWGALRSMPSLQVRPRRFPREMVYRSLLTELLVDVVDVVLEGSGIDEKFLGITLFALVPNTTEFMNAISFALNGNIALRWGVSFWFLAQYEVTDLRLLQYGNRFGVCPPGLSASGTSYGGFLCLARSGKDGLRCGDFQVRRFSFSIPSDPQSI